MKVNNAAHTVTAIPTTGYHHHYPLYVTCLAVIIGTAGLTLTRASPFSLMPHARDETGFTPPPPHNRLIAGPLQLHYRYSRSRPPQPTIIVNYS